MLELRTFGGLSVTRDGVSCGGAGARRKTLALLALLATGKKGLSRDKLIALLWPESDARHGRNLLKQACFALRRDLGERDLLLGTTELRLNPAVIACDIQQFEDALARGDAANAVATYAGAFLDGFYLDGADEFERWAGVERSRLYKRACGALETLATGAAAHGDHGTAAERWRRLADLDPLSSRAALGLMTALAAVGEVAAALRHGRAYERLVKQELGAAPEPPLSDLVNRLRLETAGAEGINEEELQLATAATGRRRTVGYEKERVALREALHAAISGRGLMVCVAGEPGSGKTTLVEDFLGEVVASGRPCHVARGRCSERLAGSGAYLPLLDGLEGLLRGDARGTVAQLMRQLAPNWYAQIAPALHEEASGAEPPPHVQLASQERLKRELHSFFQELCRLRPLVVFLDDVHWADASTVDILAYVVGRLGTTQMLFITSYRPSELLLGKHPLSPLKLDLQTRGLCSEVSLELLTRDDIQRFLALEFPSHSFPPTLAAFVHSKTEGNPLFMVDLLRYLRAKGVILADDGTWMLRGAVPDLERELPESVRSMIERKIEQLGEADLRLLLAAGVQGYEFDSPVVAKVADVDTAQLEEHVETIGRVHGFVRRLREVEFPDGTRGLRYRFVHVLYQNALYARLPPTRRALLSRAIAEALLECYRDRKVEVAAELALLFEAARDNPRAVEHFVLATERAALVMANREAVVLARRGLELLRTLPDTPERAGLELRFQLTLGHSLWVTNGYADPESEQCMLRVQEICRALGEKPQLFPAIFGLWSYYTNRSELRTAVQMADRLLAMAESAQDSVLLFAAHTAAGSNCQQLADLVSAHEHYDRAIAFYDRQKHDTYVALFGQDVGLYTWSESTRVLWLLGYPERALQRMQGTFELAREVTDQHAQAWTFIFAAFLHLYRGEPELALKYADAGVAHAIEHGMVTHQQWAMLSRGAAMAELGGLEEGYTLMRATLAAQRALGEAIIFPYWLSQIARAFVEAGRIEEGLEAVREGLKVAAATDQRSHEAELHRLQGELLLRRGISQDEAEACFREALAIAGRQQAKSLELRAATSLARLWCEVGKKGEARHLLAPIYSWFTEGFDTSDLRDAREVLDALG